MQQREGGFRLPDSVRRIVDRVSLFKQRSSQEERVMAKLEALSAASRVPGRPNTNEEAVLSSGAVSTSAPAMEEQRDAAGENSELVTVLRHNSNGTFTILRDYKNTHEARLPPQAQSSTVSPRDVSKQSYGEFEMGEW